MSKLTPAIGNSQDRWALLGCSRGLGRAFLELLQQREPSVPKLLIARKTELLKDFAPPAQIAKFDFADKETWPALLQEIQKFKPTRFVYFAGGGPFGNFASKSWKDHEWSLKVTFECPAFLLHSLWQDPNLKQLTFVGSQIAESDSDAGAASYCAAKHALKGLVTSVMEEKKEKDVRLFSPGYLETDLLPANAWPRQQSKVDSPKEAAEVMLNWLQKDDGVHQHLLWARLSKL
jgi:short-subunit dehydrogenase